MDEAFFFLFVLGLALLFFIGVPVLAIVAFLKARRFESQLEIVRRELRQLRSDIRRDQEPHEETAEAPAAAPAPPPLTVPPAPRPALRATEEEAREKVRAATSSETPPTPPPPPTPPRPPSPPRPPAWREKLAGIEWERLVGVRGAAVLGGIILALAGILFFRHAIVNDWISQPMRLAAGTVAGVLMLAAAFRLRTKSYAFAPNALEGAAVVTFYATVFAADYLYSLISTAASFPLSAVVTALACFLAMRHRSLITAVLGLIGGFATPLILATGQDRPIGFFGYVLLLDMGLLFVGRQRRWPSLGLLALLGTFLMEGLWVFGRMGPERLALGLVILGVFAVLFALSGGLVTHDERRRWAPAQASAVLFPFAFAFHFSGSIELSEHIYPIALLCGLLSVGACVVGNFQKVRWLPVGGASASVAVVAVWLAQNELGRNGLAWELAAVAACLAAIPHLFAEWEERRHARGIEGPLVQAGLASASAWMLLIVLSSGRLAGLLPWPHLVCLGALAVMLWRGAHLSSKRIFAGAAALGAGLGVAGYQIAQLRVPGDLTIDPLLYLALLGAIGAGLLVLGLRTSNAVDRCALHGVGIFYAPLSIALMTGTLSEPYDPWLFPIATLVLGLLVAASATALRNDAWMAFTILATLVLQVIWGVQFADEPRGSGQLAVAFVLVSASGTALALWPTAFMARLAGNKEFWRVSSLAAPLWVFVATPLYIERFGDGLRMLPLVLLGAVAVLAAFRIRAAWPPAVSESARNDALAWYGGGAAVLLSLAIPLQIDIDPFLVGAPVCVAAFAWLGLRLRHRGLAFFTTPIAAVSVANLCLAALQPDHYLRSESVLWNSISYVHLIPAAALILAAWLLRSFPLEGASAARTRAILTGTPALGAVVLVFVWINLEILNFFSSNESLRFDLERAQDRDLTASICWGLYALVLLGMGTVLRAGGLRWASLALFFVAIGKVFLYDLGQLEGMYRVGSLAGLAMSLIVVSLLYQRFVFRKPAVEPAA